jgi:hypothetical protein
MIEKYIDNVTFMHIAYERVEVIVKGCHDVVVVVPDGCVWP